MKKFLYVLSLLGAFLIFSTPVLAACSWEAETTTYTYSMPGGSPTINTSGGCGAKNLIKNSESSCSGTKPSYSTNSGKSAVCCCDSAATMKAEEPTLFTPPNLQIEIPGMQKFSELSCAPDGLCEIPWLGQYIVGIYNYAISIAGILAAIVLMAGGLLWLISAGDASKITQAKELIIGSITGLIILSTSYIILAQINPSLLNFKSISIRKIETIVLDTEGTEPIPVNTSAASQILGVKCGVDSVSTIVQKSKGKVTYENANRGKTGPNGTIYNDCSGFASFVLKCALNKTSDAQTASIFSNQQLWDKKIDALKPGDLIGWAPRNSKSGNGHTVIYLGNGLFGDCHGGEAGRKPGGCVSSSMTLESLVKSANKWSGGNLYFRRY